jgi:hypothetical protein
LLAKVEAAGRDEAALWVGYGFGFAVDPNEAELRCGVQ